MRKINQKNLRKIVKRVPILWFLPAGVIIFVFRLFTTLDVFRLSFTDIFLGVKEYTYTLATYIDLFSSETFYHMLRVTFIFVFFSLFIQLIVGLSLALAINRGERRSLRGRIVVRTMIFTAWVIPGIIVGTMWRSLLSDDPYGLINYILQEAPFFARLPWLYSPPLALTSLIIADVWRGAAFTMILQYAGLKGVPEVLYEAAKVDGAAVWQTFYFITLPQLRPIILINLLLLTITTFNTFDLAYSLTGGGPGRATEVISLHAYNAVFNSLYLARGTAITVILTIINLTLAIAYYKMLTK